MIIELCCAFCLYKNLHHNHKVLEIYDEEALKKENITIDNSTKEFDDKIQKIDNLKNSIQHEMIEINKTYENIDNKVTKSYKIKIEKLIKEENDLKEKLKTEVTKIKEKLENYLSEINNISKTCEKIKKGMKLMQNEEKNMIKILSYVSKINKNQKEMNILTKELMKNIKISFIEEESKIKYEEYYFNGIPIPKNIEIKDTLTNSFKVFWKLEDINLLNVDKNQFKYNIEIRKENENEKFKKIYEDNNNNYLINNNLEKNTNYEIRICAIYKGARSNWSEIKKVKTKNVDSLILKEEEKGDEYLEKLYEWTGYKNMELLYRGTRDGSGANIFHNKCDNQGPTICLCKNEKGNIFGGYASISWTSSTGYKSANGCFLFSLTNIYGTEPTKFPNSNQNNAVYHNSSYGPVFGSAYNLKICGDYLNSTNSYARIGGSYNDYQDVLGKGHSVFSGDVNTEHFKLKELEVFKVYN